MEKVNQSGVRAWATVFGYEDVEITNHDGKSAIVRVRQVRARQAYYVLAILDNEFDLLEYVCISPDGSDLPEGWVDLLTPTSHDLLVKKARALNFPVALAAVERQGALMESLGAVTPTMKQVKALQNSLTTAP